jgi:hypothetical protein
VPRAAKFGDVAIDESALDEPRERPRQRRPLRWRRAGDTEALEKLGDRDWPIRLGWQRRENAGLQKRVVHFAPGPLPRLIYSYFAILLTALGGDTRNGGAHFRFQRAQEDKDNFAYFVGVTPGNHREQHQCNASPAFIVMKQAVSFRKSR